MKNVFKLGLGLMLGATLVACQDAKPERLPEVVVSNEFVEIEVIDSNGTFIYNDIHVATIDGDTILDIMERAEQVHGVDFRTETSTYGEFITGIDEIAQEDNQYWIVYENGESTDEGVSSEDVEASDVITFKLETFE